MLVLPEIFGDEIRALLVVHPDLARFTIAYTDVESAEQLVVDTHASALKGEIWIRHVDRTPEELGVTTGTSYTEIDDWQIVVIDGLTNTTSQVQALRAIDQCLRGVTLDSATGRVEYTTGWQRITDRRADTVQAFTLSLATDYDNTLSSIGSGLVALETGGYMRLED